MTGHVLQYSGHIALVAFFTAFVGIVLWACRPGKKDWLDSCAAIPLKEDDQ